MFFKIKGYELNLAPKIGNISEYAKKNGGGFFLTKNGSILHTLTLCVALSSLLAVLSKKDGVGVCLYLCQDQTKKNCRSEKI